MEFKYNDGGRADAGFKGGAGDCVCRAIAIASSLPYLDVYNRLASGMQSQRRSKRTRKQPRSARNGIYVKRQWFKEYMREIGFEWVPTMGIGTGCKVHLHDGELPSGRLVVSVSKHYTTVIDGVVHDTHDPQREAHVTRFNGASNMVDTRVTHSISRRCVYGYWIKL